MLEVERKFRVADPAALEAKLAALGILPGGALAQFDRYYAHPSRDFARTDEALRVRREGPEVRITYKGPRLDDATKTRREIELCVGTGDDAAGELHQLLAALGFVPVADVRKRRRAATVDRGGMEVEVALDDVAGLGCFIELEIAADDEHQTAAQDRLAALVAELGLVDEERRSYLELLLAAG